MWKLKKLWLYPLLMSMSLAAAPSAQADLSVDNFIRFTTGSEDEQAMMESYIGGVGKGYLWANAYLDTQGNPALFCSEDDYTTSEFLELAIDAVEAFKKSDRKDQKVPVELLLLNRLIEIHPCE